MLLEFQSQWLYDKTRPWEGKRKNGKFDKRISSNIRYFNDIKKIIEASQHRAYQAVDAFLVQRNWLIGYRIAQEELAGSERAEYGAQIIKN